MIVFFKSILYLLRSMVVVKNPLIVKRMPTVVNQWNVTVALATSPTDEDEENDGYPLNFRLMNYLII